MAASSPISESSSVTQNQSVPSQPVKIGLLNGRGISQPTVKKCEGFENIPEIEKCADTTLDSAPTTGLPAQMPVKSDSQEVFVLNISRQDPAFASVYEDIQMTQVDEISEIDEISENPESASTEHVTEAAASMVGSELVAKFTEGFLPGMPTTGTMAEANNHTLFISSNPPLLVVGDVEKGETAKQQQEVKATLDAASSSPDLSVNTKAAINECKAQGKIATLSQQDTSIALLKGLDDFEEKLSEVAAKVGEAYEKTSSKERQSAFYAVMGTALQEINDPRTAPERVGALVKGLRKFVKATGHQKDKKFKQHKLKLRTGESLKMPEGGRALALAPCSLEKQKEKLEELKNSLNNDPTISQKKKNRWNAVFNEDKVIFLTPEQMEIADQDKDGITLDLLTKFEVRLKELIDNEKEAQTKLSETPATTSEKAKTDNQARRAITSSFVNEVKEKNLGRFFLSNIKREIKFFENERREKRKEFEREMKEAEEYKQLIRDYVRKENLKLDLDKIRIKIKEFQQEIQKQSSLAQES
jgi:hypothetical protein